MDKRYQVFVSSTFTDLREERKAIIESLLNAKYIPAGMEMFSASNDEQFKYIKKIIDTCDYYVLIVGARYGSINPSTGKSFTEQEYDYAVEKNIPVLGFLHDDPYNLPVEKRDDVNRELLEKFRTKVSDGRLCKMWNTSTELIASVIVSLGEEVKSNPQIGWTRGEFQANDMVKSERIVELQMQNEELETKIFEMENMYLIYEKEIKRVRIENQTLKNEIEENKILIEKFTKKKIDINEKIIINFQNGNHYGTIYSTWKEIFEKIQDYLTDGCNIDAFQDLLSKRLIIGEGTILKADSDWIMESFISCSLCMIYKEKLKLTLLGKNYMKK